MDMIGRGNKRIFPDEVEMQLNQNAILLVRHAQSQHHVNGMTGGWTDTPLTRLGFRQAGRLGRYLREQLPQPPAAIISSDLQRTVQTARPLSCLLDQQFILEPGLREYNNGQAAEKTRGEAERLLQSRSGTYIDWQPWPEAETWRQFYRRVAATMQSLTRQHTGPLLLVTHGGTILNIIFWWLQYAEDHLDQISFLTEPASLTLLDINSFGQRQINFLNRRDHLAGLDDQWTG